MKYSYKELEDINKHIKIIDMYTQKDSNGKNRTYCVYKCIYCQKIKTMILDNIIKGKKCAECARKISSTKYKLKNKDIEKNIAKKFNQIKVLDTNRIDGVIFVTCKCLTCGYEWNVRYGNLIHQNLGCQKCNGTISNSYEYKINEIKKLGHNVLSYSVEKISGKTRMIIKCFCDIHGEEYTSTYYKLLNGANCPKCSKEKASLKRRISIKYINNILKSNNIECIEYIDCDTKIRAHDTLLFKCKECNSDFKMTWANLSQRKYCPICFKGRTYSSKSKIISNILTKNNIKFIQEYTFDDCVYIKKLRFDYYIPSLNLCIEYDGEQHYMPIEYFGGEETFKKIQIRDKIKDEYCKTNNIRLIRIHYKNSKEYIYSIIENEIINKIEGKNG